jgi:hypothetical protein
MLRTKWCHLCKGELSPIVPVPEASDFWMRLAGESWVATRSPPAVGELASVVGYRCNPCGKTFRLAIATPAGPGGT